MPSFSIFNITIFALVSLWPYPVFAFFDVQQRQAGNYADHFLTRNNVLLYNDQLHKQIQHIGHQIAQGAGKVKGLEVKDLDLTFRILNTSEINASATSGGFIYIHSGLLDFAETKDEIAWIIGHELAHILENHYIQKYRDRELIRDAVKTSAFLMTIVGSAFLGAVASVNAPSGFSAQSTSDLATVGKLTGALGGASASFASVVLATTMYEGYSRDKELLADKLGAKYLQAAGFNPRAFIGMSKRFKYIDEKRLHLRDKHKKANNLSSSSHLFNAKPGLDERMKQLESLFPESPDTP